MNRLSLTTLALAAALAFPAAAAADWVKNGQGDCKMYQAPEHQGLTYKWSGPCRDFDVETLAHGVGAVRIYIDGEFHSAYYGQVSHGFWDVGIYDMEGWAAGKFQNNQLIPDIPLAFQAAEYAFQAADALVEIFARQGNTASATHYREIADGFMGYLSH